MRVERRPAARTASPAHEPAIAAVLVADAMLELEPVGGAA